MKIKTNKITGTTKNTALRQRESLIEFQIKESIMATDFKAYSEK